MFKDDSFRRLLSAVCLVFYLYATFNLRALFEEDVSLQQLLYAVFIAFIC